MNSNEKMQLERETIHQHWLLRLQKGCKAVYYDRRKAVFLAAYIVAVLLFWFIRNALFSLEQEDIFTVMHRASFRTLFPVAAMMGLFFLITFFGTPIGWKSIQNDLRRIGFVNHAGEAPFPLTRHQDSQNSRITVTEFETCGIPKSEWEDKQEKIESALNVCVVKIATGTDKRRILLYTIPAGSEFPHTLYWKNAQLSDADFVLILGESLLGPVSVDLSKFRISYLAVPLALEKACS